MLNNTTRLCLITELEVAKCCVCPHAVMLCSSIGKFSAKKKILDVLCFASQSNVACQHPCSTRRFVSIASQHPESHGLHLHPALPNEALLQTCSQKKKWDSNLHLMHYPRPRLSGKCKKKKKKQYIKIKKEAINNDSIYRSPCSSWAEMEVANWLLSLASVFIDAAASKDISSRRSGNRLLS